MHAQSASVAIHSSHWTQAWGDVNAIGRNVALATSEKEPANAGTLYVVATPLGNLRDVSLRALDILAAVDVIAAEDTRVTSKLLARHGITSRLVSLHEHNEARRAAEITTLLAQAKSVALVTDAGTPAVADPGALLVRTVTDAGFPVVPVPGPSAAVTALSASGLDASHWLFYGFLPASGTARRAALEPLRDLPYALVFYEAPHRIVATLEALAEAFQAEREIVIARELTKRFESIHRCPLGEAPAWLKADADRARGEFVLIVDTPLDRPKSDDAERERALSILLSELPLAHAVRLAAALTGAPRKALYARALELSKRSGR